MKKILSINIIILLLLIYQFFVNINFQCELKNLEDLVSKEKILYIEYQKNDIEEINLIINKVYKKHNEEYIKNKILKIAKTCKVYIDAIYTKKKNNIYICDIVGKSGNDIFFMNFIEKLNDLLVVKIKYIKIQKDVNFINYKVEFVVIFSEENK